MSEHISALARSLNLAEKAVAETIDLLTAGATVPFIARYRKEATGGLDEVQITTIRDGYAQLQELEKRKEFVLKTVREQGNSTPEWEQKVYSATTLTEVEDLYLPYKPKRKTRATIAKEQGLEPLAKWLWKQGNGDAWKEAERFVNRDKKVDDAEAALQGARDIIAEEISEDALLRLQLRKVYERKAVWSTKVTKKGREEEAAQKFKDYFDRNENITKMAPHRLLAMLRAQSEGFIKNSIDIEAYEADKLIEKRFLKGWNAAAKQVKQAGEDAFKRLIAPSLETEFVKALKEKADNTSIAVFAENARQLLMEAPLGQKNVLAIDPGFRTGCKMVCLSAQGELLNNETIYPHTGGPKQKEAAKKVYSKIEAYKIEAIAIGNGTAGRETESFIKSLKVPKGVKIVMVNESGASIYSASSVAREEFPQYDITVRGAVSIGRRLMDPLAELVKIDPKSIGVGQYQHDVDQKQLQQSLTDVVESCVNKVGVEVNTASKQLLTYVSGLGPTLAENIVSYRNENGPFQSRAQLKKVPRMGAKAFEQCAGFLRIREAKNPLDSSAVHPESYPVVDKMAKSQKTTVANLMANSELRKSLNPKDFVSAETGEMTIADILSELDKPGRDPRAQFENFAFDQSVNKISDLYIGMVLPGIVTNITAFGCFVDVGVHQDGLVHLSQMADRFIKDPNEVVQLRQKLKVKVLEVDEKRKRIAFTLKGVS